MLLVWTITIALAIGLVTGVEIPSVTINAPDILEFVEGETATINFTCTGFFAGQTSVSLTFVTSDGTAVSPDDYIFGPTFMDCTPSSPTVFVDIPLVDNSVHSPTKTFDISVVSDVSITGDTLLTVSILDDDCAQPCLNGGTCVSGSCQCPTGYTGTYCESVECAQPCLNGGTCVSGSCQCPTGFTGTYCESVECAQPCLNGGTCVSGSCQCPTGYTGTYCESVDCSS